MVCDCCGEKHQVRVVGSKGITGGAEVMLDYATKNSVAFHGLGRDPCKCFEVERWFEGGIDSPAEIIDDS